MYMDGQSQRLTRGQSKRSIDCVDASDGEERRGKRSRMEEKLDLLLKGQDEIKRELGARIDGVEGEVKVVSGRVDGIEQSMIRLSQRIDDVENRAGAGSGSSDSVSVANYWKARRSIRIGPSMATNRQEAMAFVQDVLVNELKLPQWEVNSYRADDVGLVVRHNRAKGQDFTMVLVTFQEVAHRDRVFSRVANLSKELKMEIVVPNHLVMKYKKLERKAYELRQDNRKTLVRFDDANQTLILLVREKVDGAKWNETTVEDSHSGGQDKQ